MIEQKWPVQGHTACKQQALENSRSCSSLSFKSCQVHQDANENRPKVAQLWPLHPQTSPSYRSPLGQWCHYHVVLDSSHSYTLSSAHPVPKLQNIISILLTTSAVATQVKPSSLPDGWLYKSLLNSSSAFTVVQHKWSNQGLANYTGHFWSMI